MTGWPKDPTLAERDAIAKEREHLAAHTDTDAMFMKAATEGPCFCEGSFQCTKHLLAERKAK